SIAASIGICGAEPAVPVAPVGPGGIPGIVPLLRVTGYETPRMWVTTRVRLPNKQRMTRETVKYSVNSFKTVLALELRDHVPDDGIPAADSVAALQHRVFDRLQRHAVVMCVDHNRCLSG